MFYSLSGFTKRIAEEIAPKLPGSTELEEIKEDKPRRGWWGYLKSAIEAMRKRCPEIRPLESDVAAYDLVIIGTPVWAAHMASPVRTFLLNHRDQFSDVAFFCTYGGSGETATLDEMVGLCEMEPAAKFALTDGEITEKTYENKMDGFISEITQRFSTGEGEATVNTDSIDEDVQLKVTS